MPSSLPTVLRSGMVLAAIAALTFFGLILISSTLAAQSTSYTATLSGGAQVPPVESTGGGSFSATLSGETLDFSLTSDAIGITQAHIHMGPADGTGGVVAFLFGLDEAGVDGIDVSGSIGADDVIGAIEGDFDALIAALDAGDAYINVHTVMYPPGEVRGQVSASASQADPAAVVEAFTAAFNSGDVDAALAWFASDAVVELRVRTDTGSAAIRADLQREIDSGTNITNTSVEVSGNHVMLIQEVRAPRVTAFGIDRILRIATFDIIDGLIVFHSRDADTSDPDTVAFQMAQMASGGGGGGGAGTGAGAGAGAGGGGAAPAALPSTGSGGLADGDQASAWFALSVAAGLASLVALAGISARAARRRRR